MQIVGWKTFFGFLEMKPPEEKKYCGWESDKITEAQKGMLRKLGIGFTGMRTKGQASFTISVAMKRKREGFATPGQMWALARLGYATLGAWSFEQAKRYMKEDGYMGRHAPDHCTYVVSKVYW